MTTGLQAGIFVGYDCRVLRRQSFTFNAKSLRAAQLLALGELSGVQIAKEIGCGYSTLWKWKNNAAFAFRVEQFRKQISEDIQSTSIARSEFRLGALQDRWSKLQQIVRERGASEQMKDVPGGTSGYLVHQVRSLGEGASADEYYFDAALAREMREIEKQAAQEAGQWVTRVDGRIEKNVTVKAEIDVKSSTRAIDLSKLNEEELLLLRKIREKATPNILARRIGGENSTVFTGVDTPEESAEDREVVAHELEDADDFGSVHDGPDDRRVVDD